MTEPILEATQIITEVNNHWQLLALLIICSSCAFTLWIRKAAGESKKLIAQSEKLEEERTARRKEARDRQISDMESRLTLVDQSLARQIADTDRTAHGVGASLDEHRKEHAIYDRQQRDCIENIDKRLRVIEDNLIERETIIKMQDKIHDIDKTSLKIYTILEERFNVQKHN